MFVCWLFLCSIVVVMGRMLLMRLMILLMLFGVSVRICSMILLL